MQTRLSDGDYPFREAVLWQIMMLSLDYRFIRYHSVSQTSNTQSGTETALEVLDGWKTPSTLRLNPRPVRQVILTVPKQGGILGRIYTKPRGQMCHVIIGQNATHSTSR